MRERNVHSLIDIRSSEDGDNRASGIVLSGGMHIELSGDFAGPFRTNSEIYEPQWTFRERLSHLQRRRRIIILVSREKGARGGLQHAGDGGVQVRGSGISGTAISLVFFTTDK